MFYDVYLSLCRRDGKKPSTVAAELRINKSNVSNWKNNGYTPRGDVIQKIADYFNVSTDYLLGADDAEKAPALTKKDERDIAKDMERLRQSLETGDGLMFDGDPLSDEAKESILAAMKMGLEIAKVKNKEKYIDFYMNNY